MSAKQLAILAVPALLLLTGANRPSVTLVESTPVETGMDDPNAPDAWQVWPAMIDSASRSVDLAAFYISNEPGSRLEPVLAALEAAGGRGVPVRILADAGFYETYPQSLDRLERADSVEVRLIDFRGLHGGPMHAKYFIVDEASVFLGSQNFDWRSLEHIHEVGLRIDHYDYARALARVFECDWKEARPLVGEISPPLPIPQTGTSTIRPDRLPYNWGTTLQQSAHQFLWPAVSPKDATCLVGWVPASLPDSIYRTGWDLPWILRLIDGARDSIHATVMTYNPESRDGTKWTVLDDALRRAAARGVRVRLMVSNWATRKPQIDYLKALQQVEGIEVRIVTIPEASTGFIPFARVTHAKYLTEDGRRCWLGTSNWEKSYFTASRNVGIVALSSELAGELDRDFLRWWDSRYSEPVQPEKEYIPPRVSD